MKIAGFNLKLLVLLLPVMPLLMGGSCATPTAPDVGVVVQAPKVTLPPLPKLVQETQPKPAGYFQSELLNYSNGSPEKPTK